MYFRIHLIKQGNEYVKYVPGILYYKDTQIKWHSFICSVHSIASTNLRGGNFNRWRVTKGVKDPCGCPCETKFQWHPPPWVRDKDMTSSGIILLTKAHTSLSRAANNYQFQIILLPFCLPQMALSEWKWGQCQLKAIPYELLNPDEFS